MRLDHIGFVVKDIKKYRDYYIKTFCAKPLSDIIDEPAHGVKIIFLENRWLFRQFLLSINQIIIQDQWNSTESCIQNIDTSLKIVRVQYNHCIISSRLCSSLYSHNDRIIP